MEAALPRGELMSVSPKQDYHADLERFEDVTGEIRAFVGQQEADTDGQAVASNLAELLNRAALSSVQEIDHIMSHLQLLREKVQGDGARVQRDLVEYATLAQSALQTTKVISESLRSRFPRRD
jgi:hypothetical protein